MAINWFPGHMHKARKDIARIMSQVDVVIEVLDARIPYSSENPLVPNLRGETPCIKLLNKADLADPATTALWVQHMEQEQGVKAIPVSSKQPGQIRQLLQTCRDLTAGRNLEARNIQAMIMGIPNVGKSTLINILAGRKIAKTGDEAGVTKSQQRIKLDERIVLTDTPGFLWPKLNPPECGYRLAATGAIKDKVFEYEDVAAFLAAYLGPNYPLALQARYGLEEVPEEEIALLDAIGRARSCVRKGGGVDLAKVSSLLVNELQAGLLGPISLETPEMVVEEETRAQQEDAAKAKQKAEKDAARRERARKNRK
ncbi:ribosome biogenesis GTPase YlqF [Marinimicrobium sp. ABcell2]|uniref:ribosome biogenesis GTPase YlqF n=1 Tax=Marinimicrobium sp. ABcell2 TaxID=3069751 RepID=UPI0027B83B68|nr:ribosome biogenesis GTPase YlqF [Marinimicrobium sp. ABcell2]MDQ2077202.1 ribosome biogenesis GTPase YlqF [Marinimicrobium sp. ABcell2]